MPTPTLASKELRLHAFQIMMDALDQEPQNIQPQPLTTTANPDSDPEFLHTNHLINPPVSSLAKLAAQLTDQVPERDFSA